MAGRHQRRRRDVAEIFLEDHHRDAEDRPVAAHHRDEALHPELPRGACLAARQVFALDSLRRAASVDATPEIFGRLAEGPQASAHRELSPQARSEPQPRDVARQERRAVHESREAHHWELHRAPPDAAAHQVSGQPLAEPRQVLPQPAQRMARQVLPQPAQRMARQEQPQDEAAEQHPGEQHRELQAGQLPFQHQAQRRVSER